MAHSTCPRVYVLDDEVIIRASLERTLVRGGFEVTCFDSSEELLPALAAHPDIVICDYHLEGVDGVELAARAKREDPRVLTVLVSGDVEDDRASSAMADGTVDRFLQKPWARGELLAALDSLLE